MRINHNIAALNTYRQLTANNANGAKSLEKLSSGYRINRAGDDAAGLAISEKMRAQIRGLGMASRNSQDSISLIQTAEGALSETHSILQRMRELAVQSANDTNVSVDRGQIQKEMDQLTSEVNRIGNATEFNTMKLLNGDRKSTYTTSSVSTTTTRVTSGSLTLSDIADYSITNGAISAGGTFSDYLTGNTITVGAGEFLTAQTGTNAGTISVSVTANGIQVSLNAPGTAGSTFSAIDTISANATGDYVYNDHGVTFTISAANFAKLSVGAGLDVTNYSGNGTVAFNDDFTTNTTTAATISNFTVTNSDTNSDTKAARFVQVDQTGGIVKVTISSDTAGTSLFVDNYSISAAGATGVVSTAGTLTYNNHGISFTYVAGFTSTGATVSAAKSLSSLVSAATTTVTNSVLTTDRALKFQVGANENQSLALEISDMRASTLGISSASGGAGFNATKTATDVTTSTLAEYTLDVSTAAKAGGSVTIINAAIETVSSERSKLGAVQNRLEHTINNLDTAAENLQASESRIRDVDMAKEMMEFTKNNILMQAAQSMLAQANQQPQGVLQLLR